MTKLIYGLIISIILFMFQLSSSTANDGLKKRGFILSERAYPFPAPFRGWKRSIDESPVQTHEKAYIPNENYARLPYRGWKRGIDEPPVQTHENYARLPYRGW